MEQREAAAPPSTNSVSTEATVAKMVIIKFIVILEVYTYMIFFSFPVKNNYLGLKHNLPRLTHFKIIDSGGQLFSMKTRILRPVCPP